MPAIRTVPSYEAEPVYIDALARSVEKHLATLSFKPEVILTSYHGIPKSYSDKGDPYRQQCLETTRLLRERLGLGEDEMRATFQSRFGPEEWLQPYTDETVKELAKTASNWWRCSILVSWPIAWKRWTKSAMRQRKSFLKTAAKTSAIFPASTIAKRA